MPIRIHVSIREATVGALVFVFIVVPSDRGLNPAKPVPDKLSLAGCHMKSNDGQACLLFSSGKENFCEQLLPKPTPRGAALTFRTAAKS
jgi:hypothetical protein